MVILKGLAWILDEVTGGDTIGAYFIVTSSRAIEVSLPSANTSEGGCELVGKATLI